MARIQPTDEGALADWLDNYGAKIRQFATNLGITEPETRAVSEDSATLSHLIRQTDAVRADAATYPEAYRHLIAFKDLMKNGPSEAVKAAFPDAFTPDILNARPGVVPRLFALIDRVRVAPGYTEAIGRDLDIVNTGVPLADHIPTGDNELLGWMQRFIEHLRPHATTLGLTTAEVNATETDHDVLAQLVRAVDNALNDRKATPLFKELVEYKDFIKWGLQENVAATFPRAAVPLAIAVVPGILPRLLPWIERLPLPVAAAAAPVMEERRPAVAVVPTPAAPVAEAPSANKWLLPLLGLLVLGGLIWFLLPKNPAPTATPTSAPATTVAAAPTPQSLEAVVAARKPEDVLVLHERAVTDWITPAADEFNKTQSGGKILLVALPSRQGRDHILYDKQKIHPVAWIPGDIYWIDKLRMDAADPKLPSKSGASVGDGKALLKTYLVLIMPEERAKVFEAAMQKPAYKNQTWKLLGDIATKGWGAVGGPANWGKLKWTHPNPVLSNTGMETLVLAFAEFERNHPGQSVNSAQFKETMGTLEASTGGKFETAHDAAAELEKSNGSYDVIVSYESDALHEIENGLHGIRIIYPAPTTVEILPATIVKANWVNDQQAQLAKAFFDYLLSQPVEEKAIAVGYRPAVEELRPKVEAFLNEGDRKSAGMVIAPDYKGTDLDTKTKEGLIYNWAQWYKDKYQTDPMAGS